MLRGIVHRETKLCVAHHTCISGCAVLGAPVPGAASGAAPPSAAVGALWQALLMVSVVCTHAMHLMSAYLCWYLQACEGQKGEALQHCL